MALDRDDIITAAAYKAANKHYDTFTSKGVNIDPEDRALQGLSRNDAVEALAIRYAGRIKEGYPEEGWGEGPGSRLRDASDGDLLNWLNGAGDSPEQQHGKQVFSEYEDLVKDGKWYSMSPSELKLKMSSKNLGFNPEDPEDVRRFFDTLAQFETEYNKGLAVDEFSRSGWGVANALLNPTAFDEAMKQSLTDAPADPGKVYDKFIVDQTANAAIGANTRGALPALLLGTAGGEFARQALNKYVDPEDEFKVAPIVAAPLAAGITSGGVRGAGRLLGRVKFPGFQGFGKGMMKGARGVNEEEAQKEALKRLLIDTRAQEGKAASTPAQQAELDANKEIAHNTLGLLGYNEIPGSEMYINAANARDITSRAKMNRPSGQNYSTAQMLGIKADDVTPITDKQVSDDIDRAFDTKFRLYKTEDPNDFTYVGKGGAGSETNDELLARSQDQYVKNIAAIKSNPYLKAKWEREADGDGTGSLVRRALIGDASGNGPAYLTGDITAGALGAFEPMTRWSPWPVVQSLYSGDVEAAKKQVGAKNDEYKNSSWYKKMKKANPQAAAAYDAAMKAKEEE